MHGTICLMSEGLWILARVLRKEDPLFLFFQPITALLFLQGKGRGPIAQLWLERAPDKGEVRGSTPLRPTIVM